MLGASINILFVESGSGYGGSAVCLYQMLRCLDRVRFTPFVFAYTHGPTIAKIENLGVETRVLKGRSAFGEIARWIRDQRVDLVHNNNELYSNIPGILAAKVTGRPCLCHMRGIRGLTRRERWVARLVDRFVAVSHTCRDRLKREGLPENKLSVVYDGVETRAFQPVPPRADPWRSLGIPPEVPVVGVVGRLARGKGHEHFIAAAGEVLRQGTEAYFVIVGEGPLKEELQSLVHRQGLEERVLFAGWRTDLREVYAGLDIVVSPSCLEESFGMINVEAMAMEKPVVATDRGAYPEVVQHGQTGRIVPAGAPRPMAEAVLALLNDADERRRMGRAGRRRVEELFDIRKNIQQIEALYATLMPKDDLF